jgi:DNA-binding transcriptional ArsR family regulator
MPKITDTVLVVNNGAEEIRLEYPSLRKVLLVLRAVNHPLRKQIMEMLAGVESMIVTNLHIQLKKEQSIVSQHLAVLRRAGVLLTKRSGKFIYYSINRNRLNDIENLVENISRKE